MNSSLMSHTFKIRVIKLGIINNRLDAASECWDELTEPEQTALWVAPKFGGIFTTEERNIIKGGFNVS